MNFYDFFYILEATFAGEDPTQMNTDDIQLQGGGGHFYYTFKVDEEPYTVNFSRTSVYLQDTITNKAYSISLEGPKGYALTGRGKAMTVYKSLLKSVKKLIDQEKPEGLSFYGAYPEQDIMYYSFYEKYLSKMYTKISKEGYLHNEFIERLKTSGSPLWPQVEQGIEQAKDTSYIDRLRQDKEKKRERRSQLASVLGTYRDAVKKIGWDSSRTIPIYIVGIGDDTGKVDYYYAGSSYLDSRDTDYTNIKPINEMPADPSNIRKLQKLIKKLQEESIQADFWGQPPEGWDQQVELPINQALKKIAWNRDYGPVYVRSYDEHYDEVALYYNSGGYIESGHCRPDEIKPIENMEQDRMLNLRGLIKALKVEYGIQAQFYGTPPTGWDQKGEPHRMAGRIGYSYDYGAVYISPEAESDDVRVPVIYARYGEVNPGTMHIGDLEPIDRLPSSSIQKLIMLVKTLKTQYGVNDVQFYGNPPQGWDESMNPQTAVGKIAWTVQTETPVYVKSVNGDQAQIMYQTGETLRTTNVDADSLAAWNTMPSYDRNRRMAYVQQLSTLLQQQGIQAQLWGGA